MILGKATGKPENNTAANGSAEVHGDISGILHNSRVWFFYLPQWIALIKGHSEGY
jgi:hypothetical protein